MNGMVDLITGELDMNLGGSYRESERRMKAARRKRQADSEGDDEDAPAKPIACKKRKKRAIVDRAYYELRMVDGIQQYIRKEPVEEATGEKTSTAPKDTPLKILLGPPMQTPQATPGTILKLNLKPKTHPKAKPKPKRVRFSNASDIVPDSPSTVVSSGPHTPISVPNVDDVAVVNNAANSCDDDGSRRSGRLRAPPKRLG